MSHPWPADHIMFLSKWVVEEDKEASTPSRINAADSGKHFFEGRRLVGDVGEKKKIIIIERYATIIHFQSKQTLPNPQCMSAVRDSS